MAELTEKTHGPEVLAKGDGTCKRCSRPIERGEDYIAKVDGIGWMHALCAKSYCEVINSHLEDDRDQVLAGSFADRARAAHILRACRDLRELDVPPTAINMIEDFAGSLVSSEAA